MYSRCESALEDYPAIPVRSFPGSYEATARFEGDRPFEAIVGAEIHQPTGRLYVFDGHSGLVTIFDPEGGTIGRFGGIGGGPGEVEEPGTTYEHNQIAVLDNHVVLSEMGFLHFFDTRGQFIDRLRTDQYPEGPLADLHVAAISDSTLLYARNGAPPFLEHPAELKARLRLIEVGMTTAARDTSEFGSLRNRLVKLLPFDRFPPRDPYGDLHHRSWDAIEGLIAFTSWRTHGVCYFDADGDLRGGGRVAAPVVDAGPEEKRRVLNRLRDEYGETAPFTGERWDEFYERWPETLPRYVDIALAPDSTAWLERPTGGGGRAWDLFHLVDGYRGTMRPLGEGAPIAFTEACVFVVTLEVGDSFPEKDFYGLTRWCLGRIPRPGPEGPGPSR